HQGAAQAQALREALRGPPPRQAAQAECHPQGQAAIPYRSVALSPRGGPRRPGVGRGYLPSCPATCWSRPKPGGPSMMGKATASPRPAPHAEQPPPTTEELLRAIEMMGQRINGYVQFMCQAGSRSGTSAEARERAIAAFHEKITAAERQLGRIEEDL